MRRILERLVAVAAVVLTAAGLMVTPAGAAEDGPVLIGDKTVSFFVTANRADPNLSMQPPADLPSPAYQMWTLKIDENTGQGLVLNEATGGCLAVHRVVIGDRRPVIQRPCDGERMELWTVKQDKDGTAVFVNAYTGACMGYEPIYVGRYPQLLEFPCTNESNQIFVLKPAT